MASDDKNQQVYPLAPAHEHPRSDEESANLQAKELKRKKRIKCAIYVAAFAVFQTAVILAFALTVMRVKNPKVRIGKLVSIERMETNNTGAAQFDLKFIAQVTNYLKAVDRWDVVEEGFVIPATMDALTEAQKEELLSFHYKDRLALTYIRMNVSDGLSVWDEIYNAKSSKEAWDILIQTYSDQTCDMDDKFVDGKEEIFDEEISRLLKIEVEDLGLWNSCLDAKFSAEIFRLSKINLDGLFAKAIFEDIVVDKIAHVGQEEYLFVDELAETFCLDQVETEIVDFLGIEKFFRFGFIGMEFFDEGKNMKDFGADFFHDEWVNIDQFFETKKQFGKFEDETVPRVKMKIQSNYNRKMLHDSTTATTIALKILVIDGIGS